MTTAPSGSSVHVPILLQPILTSLLEPFRKLPADAPAHWIVDCTFGGGGHTSSFLQAFASDPSLSRHRVLSIDQDAAAVEAGHQRFAKEIAEGRLEIQYARFGESAPFVEERPVLGLMADLGFSSDQIEDADRGLSFIKDGPLDMRLDPTRGRSCRDILFQITERELEEILKEYGEERFSRRIAGAIIESRREKKLPKTTLELADLVSKAVPSPARHGRIHAATRTFQALRIVVNEELKELDSLLESVILKIRPGGRAAILSFHSLEDRKVKQAFRALSDSDTWEILTKKPVEADEEEVRSNPRSRSAKLRIAQRSS